MHSSVRASSRLGLAVAFAVLAVASPARASLTEGPVEISMYGRVGVAWGLNGQLLQGKSMNLLGNSIGGRFEEGDYLEPTIKFHILKPEDGTTQPYAEAVITPAMFAKNGSFIGAFSNGFESTLGIELFQAYVEAGNLFIPDLKVWIGQRFYRGTDVHIADYYFFNNLSGQGGGVKYKGLDVAVLAVTGTSSLYTFDAGEFAPDIRKRVRTVGVAQYTVNFGQHSLLFLGEAHLLPEGRAVDGDLVLPSDFGWVLGVKGHLALANDGFNDLSIRYGSGIANGSRGGSQTWDTFGGLNPIGAHVGAGGIEAVDHVLLNLSPFVALNGYAIFHYNFGASGELSDRSSDWAVGARSFLYLHDNFQLINELTFQGRQDGDDPMGTALKFSIVPTLVPTGKHSVWARPHLRFIYTLAVYNQVARDRLYSPYLQLFGPQTVGHFLGIKSEWWF